MISQNSSTLPIFFISLTSFEFWYMEWNLAWSRWDGRALRPALQLLSKSNIGVTILFQISFFFFATVLQAQQLYATIFGKNGHLPIIYKLCSKMFIFWNYLTKYPYFLNSILAKLSYKWSSTLTMSSFMHIFPFKFFWKSKWNSLLLISSFT